MKCYVCVCVCVFMYVCMYVCMYVGCIERKREINIWLVFKSLELEMKFDNFTHVTCILYIDLVEILNVQLRYTFG
jgi:hypothetical protein